MLTIKHSLINVFILNLVFNITYEMNELWKVENTI